MQKQYSCIAKIFNVVVKIKKNSGKHVNIIYWDLPFISSVASLKSLEKCKCHEPEVSKALYSELWQNSFVVIDYISWSGLSKLPSMSFWKNLKKLIQSP